MQSDNTKRMMARRKYLGHVQPEWDGELYLDPYVHCYRLLILGDAVGRYSNLRCAQNTAFWLTGPLSGTKYVEATASDVSIDELCGKMIVDRYGMHSPRARGIQKRVGGRA